VTSIRLVYGLEVGSQHLEDKSLPDSLCREQGVIYLRDTKRVGQMLSFNVEELTVPYQSIRHLRTYIKERGLKWSKPKWYVFNGLE